MRIPSAGDRGFSLVETIIAVAILATCLLSLAQVFTVTGAGLQLMRATTVASILAAQKIEELRAAAVLPSGDGVELLDRDGAVIHGEAPIAYRRRWLVRPTPDDPETSTIEVRVAPATSVSDAGRAGEVTLVTIRYGPRP